MTDKRGLRQAQKIILSRRLELWLTPLLVVAPFVIGILLLTEWVYQGVILGSSLYEAEGLLGCLVLVGTLVFDVPFLRTVRFRRR
jgi:hypothetical protein